jgi:hypothetical protein
MYFQLHFRFNMGLKMKRCKCLVFVLLVLFLLEGCAVQMKPSIVDKMKAMNTLQIARTRFSGIVERTPATQAVTLISGAAFGLVGMAVIGGLSGENEYSKGRQLTKRCELPDYSMLVLNSFADMVQKEFPDWPKPGVREEPVGDDTYKSDGYVIVLSVNQVVVDAGLQAWAVAKMNDPDGNVVWEKEFTYKSKDYSRFHTTDELEADNCERLKEELEFSAGQIAEVLIDHLKYGNVTKRPAVN